jgi:acetyl-CoA carboxylase biotin carboxyl carrier protein
VPLSYKEVAEILKIIDASQCDEVALEMGDIRLVVRRSAGGAPATTGAATSIAPPARADAPRRTPDKAPATPSAPHAAAPVVAHAVAPGRKEIRAPMVGTFYRRPSPRDPAFVEVGQKITRGAPLALIEVMKLYTTIESEIDGVIERIAAEDGTLVEFDQLLFVVKPA